jgi:UDP-N-acetylglucosamine 1-carboxyvinyltransferase
MSGGYLICGGRTLLGTLSTQGSKNASFGILAALLTCPKKTNFEVFGLPKLTDIDVYLSNLESCGVSVDHQGGSTIIVAPGIQELLPPAPDIGGATRASYYLAPALAHGLGNSELTFPGGCSIGDRSMDLHFEVAKAFGMKVEISPSAYSISRGSAPEFVDYTLRFPSRGATISAIIHAASSRSKLLLRNANTSPEANALKMVLSNWLSVEWFGATVFAAPADFLPESRISISIPEDRAASANLLVATLCSPGLFVKIRDMDALRPLFEVISKSGMSICERDGNFRIDLTSATGRLDLKSGVGSNDLDADWLPALAGALCWIEGWTTALDDPINPLRHQKLAEQMRLLGAIVEVEGTRITVIGGPKGTSQAEVTATDIRSGFALLLAALHRPAPCVILGPSQVDRGYENIWQKFRNVGAQIECIT